MPSSETASVIFDSPAMRSLKTKGTSSMRLPMQVGELGRLDLEGVAGGEHRVEVERRRGVLARQSLKPPLRSSKGRPSTSFEPVQPTRLSTRRGRRPAGRAAAGHVAVAEHEVGVARVEHGEHLGELLGRVGEVAVHLADRAVAALQAPARSRRGRPCRGRPCPARCRTCIHGRSAASASASAPVPSGDASSTISSSRPVAAKRSTKQRERLAPRRRSGRRRSCRARSAGRQGSGGRRRRRRPSRRAARARAPRARRRRSATSSPAKDDQAQRERQRGGRPGADAGAEARATSAPSRSPRPPGASGTRTPSSHDSAKAPRSRKASRPAVAPSARASAQAPRPVATQPAASRATISASVRPRSGPAVSIPRACRRSCSQPPSEAPDARRRARRARAGEAARRPAPADGPRRRGSRPWRPTAPADDHGELLVAGDGQRPARVEAPTRSRARDAVGEADDAAGLVAQQERARPHARQRAGRAAGADAPQPEREGQPLQQRGDGEERDGERRAARGRSTSRTSAIASRCDQPAQARPSDGAGGEQGAQAA